MPNSFSAEELYNFFATLLSTPIFKVKGTSITVVSVFILLFLIFCVFLVSKFIKKILLTKIFPRAQMEIGTQYTLARISQYLLVVLGVIFSFQFIGIDLSGLTVIFGLLSVGIGFGLQSLTSNFVSGIIVLLERPISVGDRIMVNNIEGDVTEINIRSTKILSVHNIAYIVPNADFVSGTVVNLSHGDKRIRINISVGVGYNSDVEKVKQALNDVAFENSDVIKSPEPEIFLTNFGDSAWDMKLRVWIADATKRIQITSDLNFAIVHKFREFGIEIPFPQRDVWMKSAKTDS